MVGEWVRRLVKLEQKDKTTADPAESRGRVKLLLWRWSEGRYSFDSRWGRVGSGELRWSASKLYGAWHPLLTDGTGTYKCTGYREQQMKY
jgi:hypothetical protein